MSVRCNHCINTSQCEECDKGWKDKFIPSKEVEHYFKNGYVGVRGINGLTYHWVSDNPDLVPTHSINIDGTRYCAYCGEEMFPIQGYLAQGIDNYTVTGYCCICQGARDELEYKVKQEELTQKHEQEIKNLKNSYREKLKFCTKKLIDIKLKKIIKNCNSPYEYNYFSGISSIKDMIDY